MNPVLKHFFFSQVSSQFESIAKAKDKELIKEGKPPLNPGNLVSLSFLMTRGRTEQVIKFANYPEGKSLLTDQQRDTYGKMVGVDINRELDTCVSLNVMINLEKKVIMVMKTFSDREPETTYK